MNTEKIVNFFFEIASLRRLVRSHSQMLDMANDNISDHSFRVAIIGMTIAELEKADVNKVVKMCLFHDLAEARTGDANFIQQQYSKRYEKEAVKDQMKDIPIGPEVIALFDEYEEKQTKESIVAKDADMLDQMILQQEYLYDDPKNRKIWHEHSFAKIKTDSGKKLAKQIKESNPFEWFYKLAEEKTGEKIER